MFCKLPLSEETVIIVNCVRRLFAIIKPQIIVEVETTMKRFSGE